MVFAYTSSPSNKFFFVNASSARTDTECCACLTPDADIRNPVQPIRLKPGCTPISCKEKCMNEAAHKCIHIFCRNCLEGWIAQRQRLKQPANCPSCGDNPITYINAKEFKQMHTHEDIEKEKLILEKVKQEKHSKIRKITAALSLSILAILGGILLAILLL